MKWYVINDGVCTGPYDEEHIRNLLADGSIEPDQMLRSSDKPGTQMVISAEKLLMRTSLPQDTVDPAPIQKQKSITVDARVWFFPSADDGKPDSGPYSLKDLRVLFQEGKINSNDPIMRQRSTGQWITHQLNEMVQARAQPKSDPPPSRTRTSRSPINTDDLKSTTTHSKSLSATVMSPAELDAADDNNEFEVSEDELCFFINSRVHPGRKYGPFSRAQLKIMFAEGKLREDATVIGRSQNPNAGKQRLHDLIPKEELDQGIEALQIIHQVFHPGDNSKAVESDDQGSPAYEAPLTYAPDPQETWNQPNAFPPAAKWAAWIQHLANHPQDRLMVMHCIGYGLSFLTGCAVMYLLLRLGK